ncbi:MAG: hypothetical protein GWO42_07060, partial [Nitrospinaceae bacterium]|nr:hypothetical protein [Nitrospinaceae bacterium]
TEPFNGSNWAGTGAEAVVKGTVNVTDKLHMVITLYDVFNGKLLMERKYSADLSLKRQLAHAAANDIYREITGQESMFRSKIAYLTQSGSGQRMSVSDWDGERAKDLGLRANVL